MTALTRQSPRFSAIAEARAKAAAARKATRAASVTVRAAAKTYHKENQSGWQSRAYAEQWLASLERHAFPKFGDKPANNERPINWYRYPLRLRTH